MMKRFNEISKAFARSAETYEQVACVQNEIGCRLLERLQYLNINPKYILDLGCGTGHFSALLKKKYPKATVIGVDLAHAMLLKAKSRQKLWKKWPLAQANMLKLPFADASFDLIFANQVLHWVDERGELFRELSRVMNVEGCLMFSTLGPDTFKEIKQAFAEVDTHAHANSFADMHDVGDSLMHARFVNPVMDMEMLKVRYDSVDKMLRNLKAQGVRNINPRRNPGLTTQSTLNAFKKAYETFRQDAKYPLTYEVVYGHAWKGAQRQTAQGVETMIPVDRISRRKS